jgi:hypothetical protein
MGDASCPADCGQGDGYKKKPVAHHLDTFLSQFFVKDRFWSTLFTMAANNSQKIGKKQDR